MEQLLEIRDRVLSIYSQYEQYLSRAIRFVVCLFCVICINGRVGYQESLTGALPVVLIALICTLVSGNAAAVILAVIIVIHLFSLSLEAALVGGCIFLILLLVYFRFAPEDSTLLLLYPISSSLGISYALPIAGGLLYGPTSGFTVAVGVIVDRYLRFVQSSETVLAASGTDTDDIITMFQYLLDGVLSDRLMQVQVVAVIVGAAVVYIIRRRAIPYAWIIASAAGAVAQMVLLLAGAIVFDTNLAILPAFLGIAAAFLIGGAISFAAFNLDYSRTENTQFEDDDYYYYVKAVPKNSYAQPKRTVKTINTHRSAQEPGRRRGTAQRYYTDDEEAWNTGLFMTGDTGQGGQEDYDAQSYEDGYAGDAYEELPDTAYAGGSASSSHRNGRGLYGDATYDGSGTFTDRGYDGYDEGYAAEDYVRGDGPDDYDDGGY